VTGLEQVNKALAQMDEPTQQNSALVEENAATAKMLQEQSGTMAEQISFFSVDADKEAVAPPKRACSTHAIAGERLRFAASQTEPSIASTRRAITGRRFCPEKPQGACDIVQF
jgi:methyl-accepting chemotaxis protein